METYRNHTIDIQYIYSDYKMDGAIFRPDDDQGSRFYHQTMKQVHQAIDDELRELTEYRVTRYIPHAGKTITKFTWLNDALLFASKVNGEIEMYIGGFQEELTFN